MTNLCAFAGRFLAALALFLISTKGANAATCFHFEINIQGSVTSSLSSQPQSIFIHQFGIYRDAGIRSNPFEFVLVSGKILNAVGVAQVGDIDLMTNSWSAQNAGIASAAFDLAHGSINGNISQFQIDTAQSFQLTNPNTFVAPASVNNVFGGACPFGFENLAEICAPFQQNSILQSAFLVVRQGFGQFFFPNGQSIQGSLDLSGTALDNPNVLGRYLAEFTGRLLNAVQC